MYNLNSVSFCLDSGVHYSNKTLGWLSILELSFETVHQFRNYQTDLLRLLSIDDLWTEYSFSYDKVLSNTNIYTKLLDKIIGDNTTFKKIPRGASILDLGAGTGNISQKLAELDQGYKIVAIDNNDSMLELFKAKCEPYISDDHNVPGIVVIKQDITNLYGLTDNLFDVVILNNVLYTIQEPKSFLKEVARVLKPNGEIRISGPKKDTDLDVLFEKIRQDLEARLVFDEYENYFNHVKAINTSKLNSLLYRWSIEDIKQMLDESGFSSNIGSEKEYAGQAMIVGGTKI